MVCNLTIEEWSGVKHGHFCTTVMDKNFLFSSSFSQWDISIKYIVLIQSNLLWSFIIANILKGVY